MIFFLQISPRGYISFDRPVEVEPSSFCQMGPRQHGVIAPFISRTQVCEPTEVHYSHFRHTDQRPVARDLMDRASQDVVKFDGNSKFKATDTIIITWVGLVSEFWYHYRSGCNQTVSSIVYSCFFIL